MPFALLVDIKMDLSMHPWEMTTNWSSKTTKPKFTKTNYIQMIGRITHSVDVHPTFDVRVQSLVSNGFYLVLFILSKHLVGGLNPSEKYESQLGRLFPIFLGK